MIVEYKIEKNVKFTERRGSRKYPFVDMGVGDSFISHKLTGDKQKDDRNRAAVYNSANYFIKKNKECSGWKFTACVTSEGVRIWRIK